MGVHGARVWVEVAGAGVGEIVSSNVLHCLLRVQELRFPLAVRSGILESGGFTGGAVRRGERGEHDAVARRGWAPERAGGGTAAAAVGDDAAVGDAAAAPRGGEDAVGWRSAVLDGRELLAHCVCTHRRGTRLHALVWGVGERL